MPLLGKPATNLTLQEICKPRGECSTIPAKYFEEKRQTVHKREQKYLLSNLSTKYFVES